MKTKPIKLTKTQDKIFGYDFEYLERELKWLRESIEDSLRHANNADEMRLRILSDMRGDDREMIPISEEERLVDSILTGRNSPDINQ